MNQILKQIAGLSAPQKRQLIDKLLKNGQKYNVFPLSFAQERMWYLYNLEKENPLYNVSLRFSFRGNLDRDVFCSAMKRIVDRHEVLRTLFFSIEGVPFQQVIKDPDMPFSFHDLSFDSGDKRNEKLKIIERGNNSRIFDLSNQIPFRVDMVKLSDENFEVLYTIHHIVCDGWSLKIFIHELTAVYGSLMEHTGCSLPELPIQYADFAKWQRDEFERGGMKSQLDYWVNKLGNEPYVIDLPTDNPREDRPTYEGSFKRLDIPDELYKSLKRLMNEENTSLFMLILAVFHLLLFRYTSQREIRTGTLIANRGRDEISNVIGFFSNSLVLQTEFEDHAVSFRKVLQKVKQNCMEAYENQFVPFEKVVNSTLRGKRDPRISPLFQVIFSYEGESVLQDTRERVINLPESQMSIDFVDTGLVQFDMIFSALETKDSLFFLVNYNNHLFSEERMERMLAHYQVLLEEVTHNPDLPVNMYNILGQEEKSRLLGGFVLREHKTNAGEYLKHFVDESNAKIYILDDYRNLMPEGYPGHIYIGNINKPNGHPCITDPFFQQAFAFDTGEYGRINGSGDLELLKMSKGVIRTKTGRIKTEEVESALAGHSSIHEVKVLTKYVSNTARILVFYTADEYLSKDEVAACLSEFDLERDGIDIIRVPSFPLSASGKVDDEKLLSLSFIESGDINSVEELIRGEMTGDEYYLMMVNEYSSPSALSMDKLVPELKVERKNSDMVEAGAGIRREQLEPAFADGGELTATGPQTLGQAIAETAARYGENGIHYVSMDGSTFFQSYKELYARARQVLSLFIEQNVKAGDKVIFQFKQNKNFIETFWACHLGGFVPVPYKVPDTYREKNGTTDTLYGISGILENCWIATEEALRTEISHLRDFYDFQNEFLFMNGSPASDHSLSIPSDGEKTAVILFTSGSTGVPKGVVLRHRNLIARSLATSLLNGFSNEDISLNWMPLDHVGGIIMYHVKEVIMGCNQIQVPTELVLENPLEWLNLMDTYKVTNTWAPNFAFDLINKNLMKGNGKEWDLTSLRFILNGGEAIVSQTARAYINNLKPFGLPETCMKPAYGMSETSSAITFSHSFLLEKTSDTDTFTEVGKPIPGMSLRIVDSQDQLLKEGEIGRLQVAGQTVTAGYYKNEDANRESFTVDGWFKTGDLGFIKNGSLTITGREKNIIIINGVNYYCHEIEAAVEEVPGIETSFNAALGVRDKTGSTEKLAVFFTPLPGAHPKDLYEAIQSRILTRIGIIPDYLVPMKKEEIPKTSIGKIQRLKLGKAFTEGRYQDRILAGKDGGRGSAQESNWFFLREWKPKAALMPIRPLAPQTFLIFKDDSGLAAKTADELLAGKHHCIFVTRGNEYEYDGDSAYVINPAVSRHYSMLMESVSGNHNIAHILHFWTFDDGRCSGIKDIDTGISQLRDYQHRSVYSVLHLLKAVKRTNETLQGINFCVISKNAQPVLPSDKLDFEKGTLMGFLKSVNLEEPSVNIRHFDFDDGEKRHELIIDEISRIKGDEEVAYRADRRYVPFLKEAEFKTGKDGGYKIKKGGFYVVTGGLGGIGRLLCLELIKRYAVKLLIFGRTSLENTDAPGHENKVKAWQDITKSGDHVLYRSMDITDYKGVKKAVYEAEVAFQTRLDGIFHLAGDMDLGRHWEVYNRHLAVNETIESYEKAFEAKVYGTPVLKAIAAEYRNALFVLFSSLNGIFGGASFGAYSAANSFLYSFAQHSRFNGSIPNTFCFHWSIWNKIGMSEGNPSSAMDLSSSKGYCPVSRDDGMKSLIIGLLYGKHQLLIGLDGANEYLKSYMDWGTGFSQKLAVFHSSPLKKEFMSRLGKNMKLAVDFHYLASLPRDSMGKVDRKKLMTSNGNSQPARDRDTGPLSETQKIIVKVWRDVLETNETGLDDKFFESGGNSLKSIQLLAKLKSETGLNITVMDLFKFNTVRTLAAYIDELKTSGPEVPQENERDGNASGTYF
ncbi:MAG: SDR family NAD(P)-dependent oxidoreductase [Spirochaetales bacterium]|nr:SDR family NAD(P)-dependent oxidoreductase [Spirochaetales bacterium]